MREAIRCTKMEKYRNTHKRGVDCEDGRIYRNAYMD